MTSRWPQSRYEIYYKAAIAGATLRELIRKRAEASGHLVAIGTAEEVADTMQEWFSVGACDGFNIQPSHLMAGLDSVTGQLVPVLQERALFRTSYRESTLRGHLGIERPPGRAGESQ